MTSTHDQKNRWIQPEQRIMIDLHFISSIYFFKLISLRDFNKMHIKRIVCWVGVLFMFLPHITYFYETDWMFKYAANNSKKGRIFSWCPVNNRTVLHFTLPFLSLWWKKGSQLWTTESFAQPTDPSRKHVIFRYIKNIIFLKLKYHILLIP